MQVCVHIFSTEVFIARPVNSPFELKHTTTIVIPMKHVCPIAGDDIMSIYSIML